MKKLILLSFLLTQTLTNAFAQVTGAKYKIEYNSTTCSYDFYLIPTGSGSTAAELTSRTSRLSIVLPHGTAIGTYTANEPRSTATGTAALAWTQNDFYDDQAFTGLPGFDVVSYDAPTSSAKYSTITSGTQVLLFSLKLSTSSCGAGIRLWKNNIVQGSSVVGGDPSSSSIGNSSDYNNGFKIGTSTNGNTERYTGNTAANTTPPKPTISFSPTLTSTTFSVNATTAAGSACASPLTYAWTGPNSFSATTEDITVTPLATANYGTYTLTATDANGCTKVSSITITPTGITPLPVKLIAFDGAGSKCMSVLNWSTASEGNFKQFDVQYSIDGNQYVTVGQVLSKMNPGGSLYTFSIRQESQKGFYRLKMVDLDGRSAYSSVVTVITSCDNSVITVSPNPTSGNIKVSGVKSGNQIKVLNMMGQLVQTVTSVGTSAILDLSPYASGMYTVFVINGEITTKAAEIVKQ